MKKIALLVMVVALGLVVNAQKDSTLALTPPMGWNSWNIYACDINEQLVREVADAIVDRGLKDVGYEYVVIDDCWQIGRDSLGFIQYDPEKFPSGIKALADYIHDRGLKFGIYSDAGWKTCGGRPGSRGHEFQDAMKYAEWGVDYLKYDWCYTEGLKAEGAYLTMRDALAAAGRPIVFSMCEWGTAKPWKWASDVAHLWRTTGDICAKWEGHIEHGTWKAWSVMTILDMQVRDSVRYYAGPGHWNDPDMMEVGNNLTQSENRAHFSMWSMLAAPLIAGTNLQHAPQDVIDVLTNKEVIDVNQDVLGIQGFRFSKKDSLEVWYKPLENGDWAVCFLNRDSVDHTINYDWKSTVVVDDFSERDCDFANTDYLIRDLWQHKDIGKTKKPLKATVPSHDVLMLRLYDME